MADDIVQRIVLVGDREFTSSLQEVAEAGQKAFEKFGEAITAGLTSINGINLALAGIVGSTSILTVAAFKFTQAMSETVDAAKDLGQQLGITTEEVSGLQAAFADSGISSSQMEQAFRRLSISVQQSWSEIQRASRESADKLKGDALSIEQAQLSLANSQRDLANLERDQNDARIKSTNTLRDAELRLREVRSQQLRDRGFDTSLQDESIKRARDRLVLDNARQSVQDAALKKAREAEEQQAAAQAAALKVQKDQLELSKLQRQAEDDRKNDINNVIDAVKRTAQGDTDALKSINASAENVVKGIIGAAGDAGKALGSLRGDLTDFASPAPQAKDLLETLGKTLTNVQDPMLRTAVAARLLGRTVSQDMINVLSDPEKIKSFQDRVDSLGLSITKADVEISEGFRSALFSLQTDLTLVGVKIASVFGPTFTQVLEGVDDALTQNKDSFIALAEAIDTNAIQKFLDTMSLLSSTGSAGIKLLSQELQVVADLINKITGSDFSALDIALAPITAGFSVLKTTLETINSLISTFTNILSGDFSSAFERASAIVEKWASQFKAVGQFLTGDFKSANETLSKANDDYANRIKGMDAVEKQISDGRKRRMKELSDDAKQTSDEATSSQKAALDKGDKDYTDSVDRRIAELKRLESATKNTAAATQATRADATKTTQTVSSPFSPQPSSTVTTTTTTTPVVGGQRRADGSFVDSAGTRILPGPSGLTPPNALSAAFKAVSEKTGIPLQHLSATAGENGGFEFADDRKSGGFNLLPGLSSSVATTTEFGGIITPSQSEGAFPTTKDELKKTLDDQLQALKDDWDRQRKLNEDIARQNGGLQTLRRGQVSTNYPPPVLGHYDPVSQAFIANDPRNVGFGFTPKTNDYVFGGQKNPIPYQPGINAPLSFPSYTKALMDSLPNSVPLPRPRPAEADAKTWMDAVKEGINESELIKPTQPRPFSVPPGSDSPTGIPTGGLPERPPEPVLGEESFTEKMNTIGSAISNFFQSITSSFTNLGDKLQGKNVESGPTDALGIRGDASDATNATSEFASNTEEATSSISSLASAAESAATALDRINGGAAGATVEAATGGLIRGAGTETSDSIPAWVSDFEFIHHAGATRFWGTDFMHAVNRMDLAGVAARIPKFSMGGLVGLMSPLMPRFNAGGLVTASVDGGTMQHLGTVDLTTDHGPVRVAVDHGGLNQLRRAAVQRNLGATKKPSWVRG